MRPGSTSGRLVPLVLAALVAACTGGDGGNGPPANPGSIALSASSGTISVTQGAASTPITVTLARTSPFTGAVNLTAEGLPTGVTAAFSPAQIAGGSTTSQLTLNATAAAPAGGPTTITIRGTPVGTTTVAAATTTAQLTVVAATPPSFTFAATPVTAGAGSTGTSTLTITRAGGFTGPVTFALDNAPAGITATFGAETNNAVTMTVTVPAVVAPGPLTLNVKATATGTTPAERTVQVPLTVTAGPNFTVGATAATANAGGSGTSTLTITRSGGFAGDVTFALDNAPAGITADFGTEANGQVTMTINVASIVEPNAYTLNVKATGAGVGERTFQVPLTVAAAPTFTLSAPAQAVSLTQGQTATVNIGVARTNFQGPVTLAVSGLPQGVTGAFAAEANGTSVLTLTATGAAQVGGPVTVTVTGTANGVAGERTVTFPLNVVASQTGAFTLTPASTTVNIQQGANANVTINIARTGGFAGEVGLTAVSAPAGLNVTFNPQNAAGATSTMNIAVPANQATGPYTITITGTGAGVANATAQVTVNVTQSGGGGGGNLVWTFCGPTNQIPIWLAVQDGDGPWQQVTPDANNTYRFDFSSGRGGVTFVVPSVDEVEMAAARRVMSAQAKLARNTREMLRLRDQQAGMFRRAARRATTYSVQTWYGLTSEIGQLGGSQCLIPGAGKTVNGTVAGLGAGQTADIQLGTGNGTAGANGDFSIENVPDGTLDLFAARTTTEFGAGDITTTADRFIIRRGVNAAAGSTLPVLDFGSADAFAPATSDLTVGNVGNSAVWVFQGFNTANGTAATTFSTLGFMPGANLFTLYGVPSNKLQAGDIHDVSIMGVTLDANDEIVSMRSVTAYFRDVAPLTVNLGPEMPTPQVTPIPGGAYPRATAQVDVPANYDRYVSATKGYLDAAAAAVRSARVVRALTIPDLSNVAGFQTEWALLRNVETDVTMTGYNWVGGGVSHVNPEPGSLMFFIASVVRLILT